MRDLPENTDLLAVVSAFLKREVRPNLDGELAFQVRVAANVIDMVRRDLDGAGGSPDEERRRLVELLGEDGDLESLTRRLCERIAAGELDTDSPGLSESLWFITLNKLAVDQPGYVTYARQLNPARGQRD